MNPTSPLPIADKYPKKNILVISGFVLIIIVALAVGLILKYTHPQQITPATQDHATALRSEAQSEYELAQTARKNGNVAQAQAALTKAKLLYAQAKDSSHNKDIDSQLAVLNTEKATTPTKQSPPATE